MRAEQINPGPAGENSAAPIAATRSGRVRGSVADGVSVFKGVRYGASTEGRRFRPPQPPESWRGVSDALEFGNQSPQLELTFGGASLFADFQIVCPESEDCLFLNVWTPGVADDGKRPVMVWLHGGGFVAGSGAGAPYDGTRLCKRGDVVVVTVNHRLGLFGYFHLGDEAGSKFADSGNAGTLDLVLALQWVRDNISEFGGDPNNVTIFGESGGGCKVSALMAMPSVAGLFHKAIVQSGPLVLTHTKESAALYTDAFLQALGLGRAQLNELCAIPAPEILKRLAANPYLGWGLGPVVDGRSLPEQPFDPSAPACSADVPLLIGACKDEATSVNPAADTGAFSMGDAELRVRAEYLLAGRDIDRTLRELRTHYPFATPSDLYFTIASWFMVHRNTLVQAERKAAQPGASTFMYQLAWETPVDGGKWKAPHALDLPLVFDNVAAGKTMVGEGGQAQRVADAMSAAWISFAKSGNPGWPAYETTKRWTMIFGASSEVVSDPSKGVRELLQGPPTNALAGR